VNAKSDASLISFGILHSYFYILVGFLRKDLSLRELVRWSS